MAVGIVRWRSAGGGLEHLVLATSPGGVVADSVVIGEEGAAASYRIACDPGWRVASARFRRVGAPRPLLLERGPGGRWRQDGAERPDLDCAIDIDFAATPFTNTLPIRRLALGIGEAAEIAVAYVDFPSLAVTRRAQRYARLEEGRYGFEHAATGFRATIAVDADGLVTDYPGLFARVA